MSCDRDLGIGGDAHKQIDAKVKKGGFDIVNTPFELGRLCISYWLSYIDIVNKHFELGRSSYVSCVLCLSDIVHQLVELGTICLINRLSVSIILSARFLSNVCPATSAVRLGLLSLSSLLYARAALLHQLRDHSLRAECAVQIRTESRSLCHQQPNPEA